MGSILHGMRPREHIVDCISHTACPITHSHTLVMQCYYDLLCIYTVIYTYIYIQIYTSTYISYITIYPIMVIGRYRYKSCPWGRYGNLQLHLLTRLIEELTKQIFSSGFSAVRSRAMETATRQYMPWPWRNRMTWSACLASGDKKCGSFSLV